ncbi:hypothetical protein N0B31_10305 [Salinirubellus salinus]|uniref:Uncharacterized protein n=1 Tax=Salinirubellus salinus TaxID=1364945 RepID=A0A9E7R6U1_9EURY|nr:hypothetical protein [Salinirubellus salinus]UWM56667.1 hypothetical protein N0B31_10305 [Salinirubellus salinus]
MQSDDVYQQAKEWCDNHGYQIGDFYENAALIALGRRDSVPGEFLDLVDENGVEKKLDALLDHHGISGDGDTPTPGEGDSFSPVEGHNNISDDDVEDDEVVQGEEQEDDETEDVGETEEISDLVEAAKESGEAFSWDEMKEWAATVQSMDDSERRSVRLHPDRVGELKKSRDALMPVFYGLIAHEQNEKNMPWYPVERVKDLMREYYPDENPSENTLFRRSDASGNYYDNLCSEGWFVTNPRNNVISTSTESIRKKMDELLETGIKDYVDEVQHDDSMGRKKEWAESKPESYGGQNPDYYRTTAGRMWAEWFEIAAKVLDDEEVKENRNSSVETYEAVHEHVRWAAYTALSDNVEQREYDVTKRPETREEKEQREEKDNRSDKSRQKSNLITM